MDDLPAEKKHAAHHEEGADRVRDDDGAVAAQGRVEDRDEPEENESRLVGETRRRGKEPRAPDELSRHHGDEGDEERECEKSSEPRIGKTRADEVNHGDGADAVADDRELLSDHAENEKARDDLGRGEDDPAESELPSDAGPRDKRAHGPVSRNERHREHDALEAAARQEVFARKTRRGFFSGAALNALSCKIACALDPKGRRNEHRKEKENRR